MNKLKWFSGGAERREKAIEIMEELRNEMAQQPSTKLEMVFNQYLNELKQDGTSTPYILNRFNLTISKVILENEIRLSQKQSEFLKELRTLSYIRII